MDNFIILLNLINLFLLTNSIFTFQKMKKNRDEFKRFLGFSESLNSGSRELLNKDVVNSLSLQFRGWMESEEGKKCVDSISRGESIEYVVLEDCLLDAYLSGAIATYKAHQINVFANIKKIVN